MIAWIDFGSFAALASGGNGYENAPSVVFSQWQEVLMCEVPPRCYRMHVTINLYGLFNPINLVIRVSHT